MTTTLLTLLAISGIAFCALLVVAGGLIHTSVKRTKAVAEGGPNAPSRLLDDLRPIENLLVEFVKHSQELASLLVILPSCESPASFARLVHEIRLAKSGSADPKMIASLVGPLLLILGLAGLIRIKDGRFVVTEAGREVQKRISSPSQSVVPATWTSFTKQRTHPADPEQKERNQLIRNAVATKKTNTMNMNNRNIIMTAADHAELEAVILFTGKVSERARIEHGALQRELNRAEIVAPEDIPADVITMNSRAGLLDLESKEHIEFTLVLPRDARIDDGKISVLTSLGTAMLGYRVGDEFEWHVPYGVRRLKVTNVYFQPEAELKKAA